MIIDHDAIRQRIRDRVEADANLSLRSVSLAAIGSDSALHKFVTGQNESIKVSNLSSVADKLGVSFAWLLFGREMVGDEIALSAAQIDALASRAVDEIQPGMSLAEIRPAVAATLRAQLALVLAGQLIQDREDEVSAPGTIVQSDAPTKRSVRARSRTS